MKKVLVLFVAALLLMTPVFASVAGAAGCRRSGRVVGDDGRYGRMVQ